MTVKGPQLKRQSNKKRSSQFSFRKKTRGSKKKTSGVWRKTRKFAKKTNAALRSTRNACANGKSGGRRGPAHSQAQAQAQGTIRHQAWLPQARLASVRSVTRTYPDPSSNSQINHILFFRSPSSSFLSFIIFLLPYAFQKCGKIRS